MSADHGALIDKIRRDPEFHELVRRRSRFAWILSALMALIYFGFILLVAFAPKFLGTPIAEGSVTTIGIPLGLFVILSAFILTGIYVLRANSEYDTRTEALLRRLT